MKADGPRIRKARGAPIAPIMTGKVGIGKGDIEIKPHQDIGPPPGNIDTEMIEEAQEWRKGAPVSRLRHAIHAEAKAISLESARPGVGPRPPAAINVVILATTQENAQWDGTPEKVLAASTPGTRSNQSLIAGVIKGAVPLDCGGEAQTIMGGTPLRASKGPIPTCRTVGLPAKGQQLQQKT